MIISISGKGGVGKTTVTALLLDELARGGYPGPILAVDADPAGTLHLALNLPSPPATVAEVRDSTQLEARTVRQLPAGQSPADYLLALLREREVLVSHRRRRMALDLLAMGQPEGPGCYCSVNHALSTALAQIVASYPLVVIDNEAGLEHLSRYRLARADLLWVVATPTRPAVEVALRIFQTAERVGMQFEAGMVLNRVNGRSLPISRDLWTVRLPDSHTLARLEQAGWPAVDLSPLDPLRAALQPLVDRISEPAASNASGAAAAHRAR
jgi:CO dehydrogenase maturation factor